MMLPVGYLLTFLSKIQLKRVPYNSWAGFDPCDMFPGLRVLPSMGVPAQG